MKVHALPGIGADHRMFPHAWDIVPGLVRHDWSPYRSEHTMRQLAEAVIKWHSVRPDDVIVGASLGGMVACEIARIMPLRAIFLVASATDRRAINPLLRAISPVTRVAPFEWMQRTARRIPYNIVQMYSAVPPSFVRDMADAIFSWEGVEGIDSPIYTIHGTRDAVIPPPPRAHHWVSGGHLISITHPRECAVFVRACLRGRLAARDRVPHDDPGQSEAQCTEGRL